MRYHERPVPIRYVLVYQDQRVPLSDGETIVGRSMSCHVRFNAPTVSRQHLLLNVSPLGIMAENLSTSTGTLLNGKRITGRTPIAHGDKLTLGPREIRVERADDHDRATLTPPPRPALGLLPEGDDEDITLSEEVPAVTAGVVASFAYHTCPACRTSVPFDRATCPKCGHQWSAAQPSTRMGQITSRNVTDDVPMPNEVMAVYASDVMTIDVTLTDIQAEGAFVPTELLDAPGTECELTLLPEGQAPLPLKGTVVAARAVADRKGPAGMDVKFGEMSHGAKLWLDLYVRRKKKS
jgi:pSer/pThr/pTyr-binding forkhead associated (FHA) protein